MDQRTRVFERARNAELRNIVKLHRETAGQVAGLLTDSARRIEAILAGATSDYQRWRLPPLRASIRQVLAELNDGYAQTAASASESAWRTGQALVDAPIAAGGIRLAAVLNEIDPRELLAIRSFMTGRLADVSAVTARKIDGALAQVIAGVQTPSQAIDQVGGLVEGGRGRAFTIVRTEVGRAYSTATQERFDQAREYLPGLKKQWRRSGKVHSRVTHDLADGQIVDTDKPFLVGGVKLMFPRDPAGPAKETVNCGCSSLPYMADWEVSNPKEKPFTSVELEQSENKRRTQELRDSRYRTWSRRLVQGKDYATGTFETLGVMDRTVTDFLERKGIKARTNQVAITDRRILHMFRDSKKAGKRAIPQRYLRQLPELIENPLAVLWDKRSAEPSLLYLFKVDGEQRLGKIAVQVRRYDKRQQPRRHNFVATAGLVDRAALADTSTYEIVRGVL